MWTKNLDDDPLCNDVSYINSKLSKTDSGHQKGLTMEFSLTRRFNGSGSSPLHLLNIMLIWSLIIVILMCPSILCQSEEAALNNSPDNSDPDTAPDTAELTSPDNPCKANPCGNGVCLQEIEDSRKYECFCEDGYTGKHCETDWNDCWSNPCSNGGACIDQQADYNCTCKPGFRGKQCEINVDECLSNPCLHNGTCVDDVNGYFCECIRGFTGSNCEIDISVCNTTEKRCSNGGQCIEALGDDFFCFCPSGWKGDTCDENVDECENNPCENGGMCMDMPGNFLCGCPMGFTGDRCQLQLEQCDSNPCQNDALCFVVDDSYVCYCVPDYHGPHCEFRYNDCLLPPFPKCFHDGKCEDGVDSYSCSCDGSYSGTSCECSSEDSCINVNESRSWEPPENFVDLIAAQYTTETSEVDGVPQLDGSINPTPAGSLPTSTIVYNMTDHPVTSLFIYEIQSSELITKSLLAGDDFTIIASPTVGGDDATIVPTTVDGAQTIPPGAGAQSVVPSFIPVTIVTETVDGATLEGSGTTASPDEVDSSEDEDTSSAIDVDSSGEDMAGHPSDGGDEDLPIDGTITPPGLFGEGDKTTTISTFDQIDTDSLGEEVCDANVCRNGGTCLATLTGPKCHCPLQYAGRQCEEEVTVETPGFVGHSLLVHELNEGASGFDLLLTFRTSTPDGLLFYTGHKDQLMIASYIQEGVLKFKVSCGTQVILFTDPRNRVDTGFHQNVKITLTVDEASLMCSTIIQLNQTHTMKGEQEIIVVPAQPKDIYFGLMPHKMDPQVTIINSGFQGCMQQLQLYGEDIHLYKDAVSGRDVVECQSAVCTTQPCRSGAVCTQHEDSGSWFCNCPPGFTGTLCERPVCATNPCKYGGTCLGSKAGPGFLCLCPVGRGGALCEDEIIINQPAFTSSVGGYSSYLAYPIDPKDLVKRLEAQFHFSSPSRDQVALLFFIGQEGLHEYGSDYVAISYVKGHILLTWDLGSGPRRIFTKRPVDERYLVHSVQFGRSGRKGWLQVDSFANITGKAPGSRENLNITSKLIYLGGHDNHNFTMLPHDLPVHRGFEGCIFDLALRSPGGQLMPLQLPRLNSPVRGRNVHQCYIDVCSSNPCANGGTCIGYGASFVCECPDGKFGVTCQEDSSACTTGQNECADGSKCSVVRDGSYRCLCPLGKTGKFCKEDIQISDPLFIGEDHSTMSLLLDSAIRFNTEVAFTIEPNALDGILVHFGQSRDVRHQDFFTVMLRNGSLFMSFSLGGPRSGQSHSLTLSLCCVSIGQNYRIEAGRSGREGYLKLNEQLAKGTAPSGLTTLDVDHVVNLGGIMADYISPYEDHAEVIDPHYSGCMSNLIVNGQHYPLTLERGWTGWSIGDCDGTACGAEVCLHDGTCNVDENFSDGYNCNCEDNFTGRHCEHHALCENGGGCQNGATCRVDKETSEVQCDCMLGYMGNKCETETDITRPMFDGNGYLSFPISETKSIRHLTSFSLEIKTEATDGMILWIGEDLSSDDYLGLGLRKGMVHLVWNLGWFSRTELTIPSPTIKVNDGGWHSIKINRVRQSLDIEIDGEIYNSRVTGSYYELNTADSVLVGGADGEGKLLDITRGNFQAGFVGCVQNIIVQNIEVSASLDGITGKNVQTCLDVTS